MKTIIFIAAVAVLLAVTAAGPIKNETLIAEQAKNETLKLTKRATDVPKKNETIIGDSKNAILKDDHSKRAAEIPTKNGTLNETLKHDKVKRAADVLKKNETIINETLKHDKVKRAADVLKKNETIINETLKHDKVKRAAEIPTKNGTLNETLKHDKVKRAADVLKKNETIINETLKHDKVKRAADVLKKNETIINETLKHDKVKRAAEIPTKNGTLNETLKHDKVKRAADVLKKNETIINETLKHDKVKRAAEIPTKNGTLNETLKHAKSKRAAEVAKNETHLAEPKNDSLSIFKREEPISKQCGIEDLNKIQGRLIAKIEKQIEKLLDRDVRRRRASASSAGAGSEIGPDGKIKSTAAAKSKSGEPLPPPSPDAAPISGADGARMHDGSEEPIEALVPGPDSAPGPLPAQLASSTIPPPLPAGGAPAGTAIVQNSKSHANMINGTAIGSAIAKRATPGTVVQQVDTSGDKAVSTAEAHKGAGTTLQTIGAAGNTLGVATAFVDAKNASGVKAGDDPKLTVQKLTATGDKAITSATNKKEGGTTIQDAISEGGSLAVSTVSTEGGEEVPIQDIKLPFRAKRGLCSDIKMNDQFRTLIRTTIENAFADIKHEMLANY